jgi:hypothetical protein
MSSFEEFMKKLMEVGTKPIPSSKEGVSLYIPKPNPGVIGRLMQSYGLNRKAFADKFGLTLEELEDLERRF